MEVPSKSTFRRSLLETIQSRMRSPVLPIREPEVELVVFPTLQPVLPFAREDFNFSEINDEQIKKMLNESDQKIEIEASFGRFRGDSFIPGILSLDGFGNIRSKLMGLTSIITDSNTVVRIIQDSSNIRQVVGSGGEIDFEVKKRFNYISIPELGVRISSSSENFVEPDFDFDDLWERTMNIHKKSKRGRGPPSTLLVKRERFRESFRLVKNRVVVDMTKVIETQYKDNGETSSFTKYEVEIERTSTKLTFKMFQRIIKNVYDWSIQAEGDDGFMTMTERKYVAEIHNSLFSKEMFERNIKPREYSLFTSYMNKPVNIKINNFLNRHIEQAYLTVKLDGKRKFLLVLKEGVYFVSSQYDITRIGEGNDELSGTLIDGEFMSDRNEYYCFDILFIKMLDIRHKRFEDRLSVLSDTLTGNIPTYSTTILLKTYIKPTQDSFKIGDVGYTNVEYNIYKRISDILSLRERDFSERSDGIIFQPPHWYKNNDTYKWKPPNELTIDFIFRSLSEEERKVHKVEEEFAYWLLVGHDRTNVVFRGTKNKPYRGFVTLNEGGNYDGRIVECGWEDGSFVPMRTRPDRDRPNNKRTAVDVWRDILDPITIDTIQGKDLKVMRRFHNIIKKQMLESWVKDNSTIIDIGSGRGGDLMKWGGSRTGEVEREKKMILPGLVKGRPVRPVKQIGKKRKNWGLHKVFAIEPNEENLEELKERLASMKNYPVQIDLLNYGAEETEMIKEKITGENVMCIVAFFSLTFFTKNGDIYNKLLETIDLLPPGGKFIGIVMDGNEVEELFQKTDIQIRQYVRGELKEIIIDDKDRIESFIKRTKDRGDLEDMIQEMGDVMYYNLKDILSQDALETIVGEFDTAAHKLRETDDSASKILKSLLNYISEDLDLDIQMYLSNRKNAFYSDAFSIVSNIEASKKNQKKAWKEMSKEELEEECKNRNLNCRGFKKNQIVSQLIKMDESMGREVIVDIPERGSMVREQTEWLFNFTQFRNDLEYRNFTMLNSSLLNSGIEFYLLPQDSRTFSSLNRSFVFRKDVNVHVETIRQLRPGDVYPFVAGSLEIDEDGQTLLQYHGMERSTFNFIDSYLYASNRDYRKRIDEIDEKKEEIQKTYVLKSEKLEETYRKKMDDADDEEKKKFIEELTRKQNILNMKRKKSMSLDIDLMFRFGEAINVKKEIIKYLRGNEGVKRFSKIRGGKLAKEIMFLHDINPNDKNSMEKARDEFKNILKDLNSTAGEMYLMELMMKMYKINIFVLHGDVYKGSVSEALDDCKLYNKNYNSIILLVGGTETQKTQKGAYSQFGYETSGTSYMPLERDGEFEFPPDSNIVRVLLDRVCERTEM